MRPDNIPVLAAFLIDVERLKLVLRKAYVSDQPRRENSAEHSWHLALGLLTVAHELHLDIDIHKALVMALIHDVCEIDGGDTHVYGPQRADKYEAELRCVQRLESYGLAFGVALRELWLEYEAQISVESRWVRVLDRLMPFLVKIASEGRNWKEQSICRSQLLQVNQPVQQYAPELHAWMVEQMGLFVNKGWLRDA
ncbi:MAG: HD domain-containing protein [Pseudomonadota bacterium]